MIDAALAPEVQDGIWLVSFMEHDLGTLILRRGARTAGELVRAKSVTHAAGTQVGGLGNLGSEQLAWLEKDAANRRSRCWL